MRCTTSTPSAVRHRQSQHEAHNAVQNICTANTGVRGPEFFCCTLYVAAAELACAAATRYDGAVAISPMPVPSSSATVDVDVVAKAPGMPSLTQSLQITTPSGPRSKPVTSMCACRRSAVTASASSDQASQSLAAAQHSVAQLLYTLSDVSATAAASDAATAATDAATYTAKRYTGWFSTLADYLETVLNYLQACRLQNKSNMHMLAGQCTF